MRKAADSPMDDGRREGVSALLTAGALQHCSPPETHAARESAAGLDAAVCNMGFSALNGNPGAPHRKPNTSQLDVYLQSGQIHLET